MIARAWFLYLMCAAPAAAQDIIVTAERRAQDAKGVGANTAALDVQALVRLGAHHPAEALNRLPGVAIHRGSGAESLPAIRSPVLTGGQGAGSFLALEDGVPIRAPGFANINQMFELSLDFADRVELTRGPGSALYGSNAVHGVVNVITRSPRHASSAGSCAEDSIERFQAEIGAFGRASAGAELQTRDCQEARRQPRGIFALAQSHEDGWREQAGLDLHRALLGLDGTFGSWSIEARLTASALNQETAGFVEGANAYQSKARSKQNANPEAFRDSKAVRAQATLTQAFGDFEVRLTPFARDVQTDLLLHFFPSRALEITAQRGGGLQSALFWDPRADFSLIAGADWDRTSGTVFEFQSRPTQAGGFTQGLHYNYAVDADVAALFAQGSWRFAPDWRLIAGLRGERSVYRYDNQAPVGDVGRFRRPADRTDTFESLTPKIGLVRTSGAGALWLNLAQGARAPQITDLYSLQTLQQPGAQKVETINSSELGYRARYEDLQFEVTAFAMEKKNSAFRNADGFTVPFARTSHAGVEVAGEWRANARLSLSGWASYAEHKYAFSDVVSRAGESIRDGDDIDTAPRRLANLTATTALGRNVDFDLSWNHMGAYRTNGDGSRRYSGHDVFDARARWAVTPQVVLGLAVRNLGDTRYAERADFAFGVDRYFPAEPRAVSMSLNFKATSAAPPR
jgi:outer membrane receptor protein involved in Fe transport